MKKFLIHMSLFILVYLGCVVVLRSFAKMSPGWGNNLLAAKERSTSNENANTCFIGSSITYRSIDPELFDWLVNDSANEMHSFNFGCSGSLAPESYIFCEEFIKSGKAKNVKTIFLELTETEECGKNLYALRGNYWITPAEYSYCFETILHSSKSLSSRTRNLFFLSSGFLQKFITLREYSYLDLNDADSGRLNHSGFYPLEDEMQAAHTPDIVKRRERFLQDTAVLATKRKEMEAVYAAFNGPANSSNIQFKRLNALNELCRNNGIRLYFVIPPRLPVRDLLPVAALLPKDQLIDMNDPRKYPELFAVDHSFDAVHLNSVGSRIYTILLAKEFILRRGNTVH